MIVAMRRIAATAAFFGLVVLGGRARAERLAVPEITAPPDLVVEAAAIELLVKSSLAKLTLVSPDAPHDHTATAALARAGTGLVLDVAIVGKDGKRETTAIVAGDGDIAALASGMISQIGESTHATQLPVRPFALGDLRPYATALRTPDPAAAAALLADSQPVVASGVPAIPPAFAGLMASAPSPTARLLIARAIGSAGEVELDDISDKVVAASAHAFAALERGELAVAEAALGKEKGGLVALARAAIAVERNDARLGPLLEAALTGDQQRAALALASTVAPVHIPHALYHRLLLPLAERAAATSPGVASRLGFAAAEANVDVARALALVSVRELDHYALDALEPLLAAQRDLPKATELRLRAELAMRRRDATTSDAIAAYLAAAKAEPRAQLYAAWSKAAPRPAPAPAKRAPDPTEDDFHLAPPSTSPLELVLPIVAGVGVLVIVTFLLLRRRRHARRPSVPPPVARPVRRVERSAPEATGPLPSPVEARPAARLKIDMTTPAAPALPDVPLAPPTSRGRSYPAAAEQSALGDRLQGLIDVDLHAPAAAEPPRVKPQTLPPPIEIASASRSLLDVDRHTPVPKQSQIDVADFFGLAGAPPRAKRPSDGIAIEDLGLAAPDLMPLGGAPAVASTRASTGIPFDDVELGAPDMQPSRGDPRGYPESAARDAFADLALDAPRTPTAPPPFDHPNLVAPGARAEGTTLAAIIADRGELPWLEAVGLIDQICAGLAHAHAQGMLHGGIQPSAIFVAGRVARLGDFGATTKRPYIAPDRNGTASDDLYAIGAVLAVMLGSGDMPPQLSKLVTDLRLPLAKRPRAVAAVRAAFKALFDF